MLHEYNHPSFVSVPCFCDAQRFALFQESDCSDCMAWFCCASCANCQEYAELQHRKIETHEEFDHFGGC